MHFRGVLLNTNRFEGKLVKIRLVILNHLVTSRAIVFAHFPSCFSRRGDKNCGRAHLVGAFHWFKYKKRWQGLIQPRTRGRSHERGMRPHERTMRCEKSKFPLVMQIEFGVTKIPIIENL
jgi:hypothetical protein